MSDVTETAEGEASAQPGPPAPPAFATVIDSEGRVMRLSPDVDGAIVLTLSGRINPLRFDRFQAGALKAAFAALDDAPGYVFQRTAGRAE